MTSYKAAHHGLRHATTLSLPLKSVTIQTPDSLCLPVHPQTTIDEAAEDLEQPSRVSSPAPNPNPSPIQAAHYHTLLLFPHEAVTQQELERAIQIQKSLPTELDAVLQHSEAWQFDAFALHDASDGRPLSTLAFFYLSKVRSRPCDLHEFPAQMRCTHA